MPIELEIVSPEKLLLSKSVDMVVIPAAEGEMGVLVNHAPMIVLLRGGTIRLYQGNKITEQFYVDGGFAEVTQSRVTVLANEATPLAELSRAEGQTRLVNGIGGGVGVAAAQIARDFGINVIGTASEDKRALVETLGATMIASGDDVAERIRQILPDGVDAIFDLAGGDSLRAVAELVTDRSKLISAGDPVAAELGGHMIERDRTHRVLEIVGAMVAEGKLDPHVEDVRPLEEAADAVAAVEIGHARGKVVVRVST